MTITKAVRQRLQSVRINQGFTRVEAFIGDLHTGVVKVDDTNNSRIYVTIQKTGQVIQAKNNKCPNRLRFPVWIGIPENSRVPHVLESRDLHPQTAFPEVPEHNHTIFESDNPTWVRREQVLDGLPMPIGGMEIRIHNYPAYVDGTFVTVHKVFDMSTYVPASGARWVNVEVDADGDISYVPGDSFASRDFLAPSAIPVTPANRKLLFSLKTYASQTGVTYTRIDSDIFDPRFSGMSSGGGTALAVDWDDILDKPLVFPPDLEYVVGRYISNAPPDENDDEGEGYRKLDLWLDQSTGIWYICIDNAEGAAVWQTVGEGGGGSGDLIFQVEGGLSVMNSAAQPILITKDTTISAVYLYCETTGASGQTTIDVTLNDVYESSIFDDVYPVLPILPYDDANGWVKIVPTVTEFSEGDVLKLNIEEIADGAQNMVVVLQVSGSGGGGSFNLTVTDGVTTISPTGIITVEGAELSDEGGGEAKIVVSPIPDIPSITVTPSGTLTTTSSSFADVDGANMEITITKRMADTDILIDFRGALYSTGANTDVEFALREGSTDHVCHYRYINQANTWIECSSLLRVTGLSAGSKTFRLRWRRVSGSGTLTTTNIGRFYLSAQEVQ